MLSAAQRHPLSRKHDEHLPNDRTLPRWQKHRLTDDLLERRLSTSRPLSLLRGLLPPLPVSA